jgi:hypothetical protein
MSFRAAARDRARRTRIRYVGLVRRLPPCRTRMRREYANTAVTLCVALGESLVRPSVKYRKLDWYGCRLPAG